MVVSYVGFETQQINVADKTSVEITLVQQTKTLMTLW
jgi:hypothetical protein